MLDSDEESGNSEEDADATSDSGSEFSEDEEAEPASESDADSSDVADSEEEEDIKPAAKRQKKVSLTIPQDSHSAKVPSFGKPYILHVDMHRSQALLSYNSLLVGTPFFLYLCLSSPSWGQHRGKYH